MLEAKIEELTQAIKVLTETIKSQQTITDRKEINEEQAERVEKAVNPLIKDEPPVPVEALEPSDLVTHPIDHDTLRDLALETNRANPDKKKALKAMLKEYGASKIYDLKGGDIETVFNRIMKGDY